MPRNTIQIGIRTFLSKKAAIEAFRQMKLGYAIGVPVEEPDHSEWLALIMRTPWFQDFVDHGIHHFEARPDLRNPRTVGMVLVNDAGEVKPFSIPRSVRATPTTPRSALMAAMRAEVRNAHRADKEIARAGDPMAQVEARHWAVSAFAPMVDAFLTTIGSTSAGVAVQPDLIHGFRLADRELAREWRDFYRSRAQVDIVAVEDDVTADVN